MQANYTFVFNRKNKELAPGDTALVQLRITLNRATKYIGTNIYLTAAQWDSKRHRVTNHHNAIKLNAMLAAVLNKAQAVEFDAHANKQPFTLNMLTAGPAADSEPLTAFILREAEKKRQAIGTYNHVRSLCNIIDKSGIFGNVQTLTLSNVMLFDAYLYRNAKSVAYINKRHSQLHHYAVKALKQQLIAADPYADFELSAPPPSKRKFLSIEMLRQLAAHDFTPRLASIRDMFLFSCFTGLAYKDVAKLTAADIVTYSDQQFIVTDRTKTDAESAIPLLPQAAAIIDKYRRHDRDQLIPIVSNQKFNGYLKEIQTICNIPINLTHHVARHTFATTVTLENHVPIETVSRMLGHRSIKTTQIYAKITRQKLAADMGPVADLLDM